MSKEVQNWQLRWAWFQLGCRCIFNPDHEKIIEDPRCPVHGFDVTKNTFLAWDVPLEAPEVNTDA